MSVMMDRTIFSQLYGMFQKCVLATEWVSGEVIPVQSGLQGPHLQIITETSSLTSEDDLQFTVPKTSLSFETYGFVHLKTNLKTLKVYSKRGI